MRYVKSNDFIEFEFEINEKCQNCANAQMRSFDTFGTVKRISDTIILWLKKLYSQKEYYINWFTNRIIGLTNRNDLYKIINNSNVLLNQ